MLKCYCWNVFNPYDFASQGNKPKLKKLSEMVLKVRIQEGAHNSVSYRFIDIVSAWHWINKEKFLRKCTSTVTSVLMLDEKSTHYYMHLFMSRELHGNYAVVSIDRGDKMLLNLLDIKTEYRQGRSFRV